MRHEAQVTMKETCSTAVAFYDPYQQGVSPRPAERAWQSSLLTCLLLLVGWLWVFNAQAITVTRSPNACESRTGTGSVAWTSPGRATALDGSYATASVDGTTTNYLWCSGYGFSIPAGSVINGITVNVRRKSSSTSNSGSKDATLRLLKGGAIAGNEGASSTTYTTSDVTEAHGSSTSLWGLAWTAAEINASGFGAAFAAIKGNSGGNAHTISVDHIEIAVDYSLFSVTSISLASPDPTANDSTVSWKVTFNAPAYNVSMADFSVTQTDTLTGSTITGVSGSGTSWTVNAKVGSSGYGSLGLNLVDRGTIKDAGGNPLGGGIGSGGFSGASYTIPKPFCSPPAGAPDGLTCVCDTFGRTALNPSTIFGANWIPSTSDDTGILPRIVNSGRLRLTDNTGNNAKAVTAPGIFPAAGNYISVEFQLYAYNGSGADGVAVTLSDYAAPAVPGAFGGSLGYAQKTGTDCGKAGGCPGFAGGWIGVALDEFGNYSNPTEGRIGGPGAVAQSIGVRGSGSGATGYNWLGGRTGVSPNIDSRASSTAAPGHTYQVIVDARQYMPQTKIAAVQVNRDSGSGYISQVNIPNVYTVNASQAVVPANWQISFTGSTGGSTNIHEIGSVRICAQTVYPPGGGTASDFNAIDEGYGNASASPFVAVQNYLNGHIYTKLMGVPFKLNVAALDKNQIQNTYAFSGTKSVTVKLVDNSDGACVLDDTQANYCSTTCKNRAAVASQTMSFAAADKGQKRSADFTINTAYKNLAAIISDGTVTACATDGFAVRPTGIDPVVSSANGSGTAGTPIFKAGGDKFRLTATIPGVTGAANGYTGTLKIDRKVIQPVEPATKVGVLDGTRTFPPATSGTPNSTTTDFNFTYSEVGVATLLGYSPVVVGDTRLRTIYDGVVGATECASPVTVELCEAFRAATWTGVDSISTKRDCVPDSYSNVKDDDGKYGCNFGMVKPLTIGRFVPNHFELSAASLKNRNDLACSPPSAFTYMNEPILTTFTLTAKNAGNETTENYEGTLAKLNLTDPTSFNLGALDGARWTDRLASLTSSGSWSKGVASNIQLGFQFARAATGPDGPFVPQFGIAPKEPKTPNGDEVALLSSVYNLDIDPPSPANDHALIGKTSVRFGRLKLGNAFGSEKYDLTIPLEAQYWNGVAFITNPDDSCTPLSGANAVLGNYTPGLNAANMGIGHLSGLGTLSGGRSLLKLTKPSPSAVGSVDLAIKLGTGTANAMSCPATIGSATGAKLEYLQSQWCGNDFSRDPRARIRFGVYKNANEMIYLREMY